MGLDAIIISDSGADSFSGISHLRLELDGKTALIQVVLNYLKHQGEVVLPIEGDNNRSWSSALKLNGIYLFSYLIKHDFDVKLINNYYEERDTFCGLLQQSPRAVIISTTFIHNKQTLRKLVDDIRSLAPDIFIIAGGPFVYLSYLILQKSGEQHYDTESPKKDYLFLDNENEPSIDLYIISLRGEQILSETLRKIKQGRQIDDIPNSAHLMGESYSFSRRVDDVSTTESFVIDWKILPDKVFESGVVPIQASTGCPYKCAFCNFTKDRRLISVKPIDQLITELKAVSTRGVRFVRFVDDNFRLGMDDLNSVFNRFIKENLNIRWMSFVRASTLQNVDFDLLRRSGCIELQLGFESADLQLLRNMNKKASPKLYAEVIRNLFSVGINASCCFIFGFPGETEQSALRTRKFIKSIEYPELDGVLSWSVFPFMLAPMSPIYEFEMRKKYGLTGYMQNWTHKTMDFGQAMEQIKKTFFELENSGPIYRGDNIDILLGLTPYQRQKFVATRHRLSKLAVNSNLEKFDIINSFTDAIVAK